MEIQNLPIDDIVPYHRNPRHNDATVDAVAESIRSYGFKQPIVIDGDRVIIIGHSRYRAARKLEMDTVPCLIADDLSADKAAELRLVDNKTGELATWDMDKLTQELRELDIADMESFFPDMEEWLKDPVANHTPVTAKEIEKTNDRLDHRFDEPVTPVDRLEVTCPHCLEQFSLDKEFILSLIDGATGER